MKHLAVPDPNHPDSEHHRLPACGITLDQAYEREGKRMILMTTRFEDVDCEPCRKKVLREATKLSFPS